MFQSSSHRPLRPILLACLAIFLAAASAKAQTFLGLTAPRPGGFWEGETDYDFALRPAGTIHAIMLFARFSDTTSDELTEDLYTRLAPQGEAYFARASYGKVTLRIDRTHTWIAMDHPSTWPGYKTSGFTTQRSHIEEAIRKAPPDVDFTRYDIVYVVDSRSPGMPNSPTFGAPKGQGIPIQGTEIRHGVTFGNDFRGDRWGWETLSHETGHIFGLPDLYSFDFDHGYKYIQRYVGFWDMMGYQAMGSEYLAWQKRKLNWLTDDDFVVVTSAGTITATITSIYETGGKKAVVIPISQTEAYVAEVRSRNGHPENPLGVLLYRVSLTAGREGHIQIIPAAPDDGDPALERRYITLYNALYHSGTVLNDPALPVRIEILSQTGTSFRLRVTR